MRHGKKKAPHQKKHALTNMAESLLRHKRITTTLAQAKELRRFIEPIITKAKVDSMHNRRQVFAKFQHKLIVQELFNNIIPRIGNRPGGYTSIIRTKKRLGDGAQMAMIQLIDYNEHLLTRNAIVKKTTEQTPTTPAE